MPRILIRFDNNNLDEALQKFYQTLYPNLCKNAAHTVNGARSAQGRGKGGLSLLPLEAPPELALIYKKVSTNVSLQRLSTAFLYERPYEHLSTTPRRLLARKSAQISPRSTIKRVTLWLGIKLCTRLCKRLCKKLRVKLYAEFYQSSPRS